MTGRSTAIFSLAYLLTFKTEGQADKTSRYYWHYLTPLINVIKLVIKPSPQWFIYIKDDSLTASVFIISAILCYAFWLVKTIVVKTAVKIALQ